MSPWRRFLGVATLLLPLGTGASASPPGTSLLPDTRGRIESAALSVNSARRAALRNAGLVGRIVNGLPGSVEVYILANDLAAFTVARTPDPDRIRFLELPEASPITIWAQDPFLVLERADGSGVLLASRSFERADDRLMAEKIAGSAGMALRQSALLFEGGNIVSDEETIFVGANTIRHNAVEFGLPEAEIVTRFQDELGRRVLVVGPLPQPVSHIDMVLTPIGERGLALADPAAGARIVRQAIEEDPGTVAAFEQACEENFFGHPGITEIPGEGGQPITAPEMDGETTRMAAISDRLGPVFDRIGRGLEEYGYTVHRIPFLFGGPESVPPDRQEAGQRAGYPMLTYNNVLLQAEGDVRRVYLPRYGLGAMDAAASRAWERLGFHASHIDGVTISAMYGGALRCAVKVLRRSPGPGGP